MKMLVELEYNYALMYYSVQNIFRLCIDNKSNFWLLKIKIGGVYVGYFIQDII